MVRAIRKLAVTRPAAEHRYPAKMLVTPRHRVDPEGHVLQLTPGREYEVLGLESDWYRILNDQDDPVLYSPSRSRGQS